MTTLKTRRVSFGFGQGRSFAALRMTIQNKGKSKCKDNRRSFAALRVTTLKTRGSPSASLRAGFRCGQDDNSKQRQEQMQRQPQVLRFAQDDSTKNRQVPFGFAQGSKDNRRSFAALRMTIHQEGAPWLRGLRGCGVEALGVLRMSSLDGAWRCGRGRWRCPRTIRRSR
jgi:hypothetical protein